VDDKITLVDPLDESKTVEATIAGIYEETQSDDNKMNMFTNSANTIITNTTLTTKIKEANSELSVETKPTFTLTSSEVIEKFEKELRNKGLSENLSVETNLTQLEESTKSISNVKTFAITFLVITLIIGTVVLLVINMINIRERKYEIGVLRTIGMKKSKVALQFLTELLIIATIFLLVGAGIGACLSVPVSNNLLKNEITASKEESENIENNFGHQRPGQDMPNNKGMQPEKRNFKGETKIEAFESIDAVVNIKVLLELLGIGLVITLISCISAIITIERFSPLTILKERT
ncbi:MAG: ABC transporter permease, partial [Bacilli bacterium]|nr:ABC transporter permease [Bacilli bacterium]